MFWAQYTAWLINRGPIKRCLLYLQKPIDLLVKKERLATLASFLVRLEMEKEKKFWKALGWIYGLAYYPGAYCFCFYWAYCCCLLIVFTTKTIAWLLKRTPGNPGFFSRPSGDGGKKTELTRGANTAASSWFTRHLRRPSQWIVRARYFREH